jgi:hypothetical protein
MDNQPIILYVNNTGQDLTDQLKANGRALSLSSGASVSFKMREADNDTIVVDELANIVSANQGKVSYSWGATDLSEAGEYFGWWEITDSGQVFETEELFIIIAQHAPGFRTTVGPIYRAAKSFMPITWQRLEESLNYGDKQLQNKIEIAKITLYGSELSVEDEYDLDIRVVDYLAKVSVISVIPAGKDYWASMASSKTTTGTDEEVSYPDRIEMLEQLHEQLTKEIAMSRDEISGIINLPSVRSTNAIPGVSDGTDVGYITPNPHTNFRDYGFAVNSDGRRRNAT